MIVTLLLSVMGQISVIPYAELIEDSARLIRFGVAHDALLADAPLLEQHRGLVAFFETHSSLDLAERAYRDHLRSPAFGPLVAAFEETLLDDATARDRYDAYYDAIARDKNLSARVDALQRIELRERRNDASFTEAMIYLKMHPIEAATFLERPTRLIPTPEALYDLRDRFRRDTDLREELREAFENLDREAGAHAYVFPWWQRSYDETTDLGQASRALAQHLGRNAQRYWIARRRDEAWAALPHARSWLWNLNGAIRRNDALRGTYLDFVGSLRDLPDLNDALEKRWEEDFGPPPKWPPAGDPPELEPWKALSRVPVERPERPTDLNRDDLMPARPTRPDRSGLTTPTRPQRPTRAEPVNP